MPPPNTAMGDIFVTVHPQHFVDQVGEVTIAWAVTNVTGTGDTYQDVIDTLDNQWKNSGLVNLASTSVTFRPSRLYVMDPTTGLASQIAVTGNANVNGTDTFGCTPSQAAPVIKKLTAKAGRSGRGRMFHPFVCKDQLSFNGEMTSGYVTLLTAGYQGAFATLNSGTAPNAQTSNPVLLHRAPLPLTYDTISTLVASGLLGTQKRRGDYGRTNP